MRAVFLDRDGVINVDKGYVYRWSDFEFLPGAVEALQKLDRAGYVLIIITNQSGIARGYFTEAQYFELMTRLQGWLEERGVRLRGIYHCPHHPDGVVEKYSTKCDCRKPAPGMLIKASLEHNLELGKSIMIGNSLSDIRAAKAAGTGAAYLIRSDEAPNEMANGTFATVKACADYLVFSEQRMGSIL